MSEIKVSVVEREVRWAGRNGEWEKFPQKTFPGSAIPSGILIRGLRENLNCLSFEMYCTFEKNIQSLSGERKGCVWTGNFPANFLSNIPIQFNDLTLLSYFYMIGWHSVVCL